MRGIYRQAIKIISSIAVCSTILLNTAYPVVSAADKKYSKHSSISLDNIDKNSALSADELKKKTTKAKTDLKAAGFEDVDKEIGSENPLSWKQCDERWGNTYHQVDGTDNTVWNAGCKAMSVSVLIALSGTGGEGFSPLVFFQRMKEYGASAYDSEQVLNVDYIKNYNGDFQYIGRVSSDKMSYKDYLDSMKGAMQAGLYVSPDVNTSGGHYVAAVDWDDTSVIVADVGYKGSLDTDLPYDMVNIKEDGTSTGVDRWNRSTAYNVYWCSKPFKRVGDGSKIGQDTGTSEGTSEESGADFNYIGLTKWMDEYDIIENSKLSEDAIALLSREDCSIGDITSINEWKENIENTSYEKVGKYIRGSILFVGILITLYSILLFLAYVFDSINNFLDFDALSVLTFGKLQKAPDPDSSTFTPENPKTRLVTLKDIIGVTISGVLIGVLLISGKIFVLVTNLINFMKNAF